MAGNENSGRKPEPVIELTQEQQDLALTMAANGDTMRKIREALDVNAEQLRKYLVKYPLFQSSLASARQEGLEELADSLQDIPELISDVQRARLKSENLRWVLSKRKPQVYGDRIEVNMNQTVDIGAALLEARSRASLPIMPTNAIIDADSSIITDSYSASATDNVSVADDGIDILS